MIHKHVLLKDLWNAALEERITAYSRAGRSVRLSDQEKSLKEIRLDVGGWKGLVHTHEAQTVLKRLDGSHASGAPTGSVVGATRNMATASGSRCGMVGAMDISPSSASAGCRCEVLRARLDVS